MLWDADTASVDDLAAREDCNARHINMTISLAFVAPALVKAGTKGCLPPGIGVARLFNSPAEWERQHKMLGLGTQTPFLLKNWTNRAV
jgi:site-specific DNA recombinase